MNTKAVYQITSVIMTLVLILGNAIHTQAATAPSLYWGAMVNGNVPSTTNLSGVINMFETRSNKNMSIIHWGQSWMMKDGTWGEFQTSYFTNVRNHGSIPMLNWTSQQLGAGVAQSNFQLSDITAGTYDTYIRRWATEAKNWGHPFFLRFDHEMNGWWYPWGEGKLSSGGTVNGNSAGDFVKAWRHVHDIFTAVGATNVTWVWAPNHIGNSSQYPALSTLYPGDAYVDWTGLSVYNKYPTWAGLNPLLTGSQGMTWLKDSYNIVLGIAPSKPMMLAEFASVEAGDGGAKKAAWIQDALTTQIPTNFPKIKAVVYMNWDINAGKTYPIESSTAATNAWATGIASGVYASNQYANLNTSPIPALAASAATVLTETPVASPTATSVPVTATPTTVTISPTAIAASPTTAPVTSTLLTASVNPVADSYTNSSTPALTSGASTTLIVDTSPLQTTFFKFDLTPLAGKTVATVTLRIKTTADTVAGSANSANIKLVNDVLWKEPYLSFNNSVAVSATVLGTVPANSAPGTWYEIALSPTTIQPTLGGLLSVAIEATGSDELLLYSREATDKPQLIVTYK